MDLNEAAEVYKEFRDIKSRSDWSNGPTATSERIEAMERLADAYLAVLADPTTIPAVKRLVDLVAAACKLTAYGHWVGQNADSYDYYGSVHNIVGTDWNAFTEALAAVLQENQAKALAALAGGK